MDKNKCNSCGEAKCSCKNKEFTKAVIEIDNPEQITLMRKVVIPASMGDDTTVPPVVGKYHNVLLYYEANHKSYLYSSDGIPTLLANGLTDYEQAVNLPQINGYTLLGNKSADDLGLQDKLTAGDGIEIDGSNTISISDIEQYAHFFDTVADMKADTNLKAGDFARTLGFHTLNDGGGATYYITDTGTANEMNIIAVGDLYANLVINPNELNVKQFGAYGDGVHDDADAIQATIDYGRTNNYYRALLPAGTYNVSKVVEIPELMYVYGANFSNTKIVKTTNTLSSDGVDAVIILRKTADYAGSYTEKQQLHDITINGNSTTTYGIYCPTACPRLRLYNLGIQYVETGVKIASGWVFSIENVSVNPVENGFDIRGTSTTLNLKNTYVYGGTGTGYYLSGITYSGLENIACDGNTGTPYNFQFCNLSIDGFGCECPGSTCAMNIGNSRMDINNGTVVVNPTNADYNCIQIGGSFAKINKVVFHDFGNNNAETAGRFLRIQNNSNLDFIECTADKKFATANYYYSVEDTQYLTDKNGTYIVNGNASFSGLGHVTKNQQDFIDFTNQNFHMGGIIFNNRGGARYSLDGTDRRYKAAHELGDIFVNQAPALNGIALLQQTSDSQPREMAGAVTAVNISGGTGTITMTTLDLTDFSKNRGLVVETNHNISSSSGGSAKITGIDFDTSTLTVSDATGTFNISDTITYKGKTDIGSSTYSNIQSIGYGTTAQRPGSPVNGYMYWDTTLGKPIWRVGNNWKDATGTNV